ncbi:MAG: SDR family NAD(P)-dependent oxidoreductase, partial [Candidatus Puniceispirillaceae bacterium]
MSHKSPRTILITGASKGIGHACALAFAGCGDKLILAARSADKLQEAAEQCRTAGAASVELIPADISTDKARIACAEETGPVDILVNNAGAIRGGGLFDMHLDEWRQSW